MSYADTLSIGCSKRLRNTHARKKKQKKISVEQFNKYFQDIENIQYWLAADDSEIEILNEDDRLYIVE